MKKILYAIILIVLPAIGFAQCTTTNATSCVCEDNTQTDCDLLPDIGVGHPPFYMYGDEYGVIEYSQTGNQPSDNGKLYVTVSTPNPGHGPLEVRTTDIFICGTDTFVGTAPSICPDGVTFPGILITQRIYHKNGNTMTYYDRPAGTMTYHPTHGHMHVDNWGNYSLRIRDTTESNPLNWPVVGAGTKLAYCLMDYGTCPGYDDHCLDSAGNSLNNASDFPNYGLGGGNYNCSPVVQGISSGHVDVYWTSLDGMWIQIPPGTCNGQYYIVTEVDPNNNFLEEDETNNVYAAPYMVTKQEPNPATQQIGISISNSSVNLCQGESVTLGAMLDAAPNISYLWNNGDTTESTTVSAAGTYTVQVTNQCGTGVSLPVTVNVYTPPAAPVADEDSIQVPGTAVLGATGTGLIKWYDQASGGTMLDTGAVFNTPFINVTTTFYAEAEETHSGASFTTGLPDNTTAGTGGYYTGDQSMVFDCYNPFILHTVKVYAQNAGNRIIELYDDNDDLVDSAHVYVTAGMNVLTLDFSITPGTGYKLTRSGGELYRNDPNTSLGYPFTVPNIFSLTGSTAGSGYYYFFYDWTLKLPDNSCVSPRVPVTAYVESPNLIAEVANIRSLSIYPNPAKENVTVSYLLDENTISTIEILDATGRIISSRILKGMEVKASFDVSMLSAGVYGIHIVSEGKNHYARMIVN